MNATYAWIKAGHFIGVFLWMSGMVSVYWLLRLHVHAPPAAHEKLTLMERSLALMMDIASALAIGCGIAMIFSQEPNFLKSPPDGSRGWFHAKLAIVVVGLLPMHGVLRARVKRFGAGKISPVPQWQWSLILASLISVVILVTAVRYKMEIEPRMTPRAASPARAM